MIASRDCRVSYAQQTVNKLFFNISEEKTQGPHFNGKPNEKLSEKL